MDIEKVKRDIPQLAQILREELTGSQAFLFKAFCEHVDALVNWNMVNADALAKRVQDLEKQLETPNTEVN